MSSNLFFFPYPGVPLGIPMISSCPSKDNICAFKCLCTLSLSKLDSGCGDSVSQSRDKQRGACLFVMHWLLGLQSGALEVILELGGGIGQERSVCACLRSATSSLCG